MSGIIGIVNLDGEPVDPGLMHRLTSSMTFRGPDAINVWMEGSVGFGHTLLRTTYESEHEVQPLGHEDGLWICADARIDARSELIAKLGADALRGNHPPTDPELILHAYRRWGQDCSQHLLGDFAFAIWDRRAQILFCARDHFGVKPFYYLHTKKHFVFSNTLNSLRLHPSVSGELDELAIADFLLFELNTQFDRTSFADVKKLPPAHTLSISPSAAPHLRRYWSLPLESRIEYRKASEYVDHFNHVFKAAVTDRLRTERISVLMSGGLDSPSIAATAKSAGLRSGQPSHLHAHTMVYDRLFPDSERYYSGLVANHLGIPIHYQVLDDYKLYERFDEPGMTRPEPIHAPLEAMILDHYGRAASTARVALSGDGGDVAFCPSSNYLSFLLRSGQLWYVLKSASHLWPSTHRLPRIGIRTMLKPWVRKRTWEMTYPDWLNRDLELRFDLRNIWNCQTNRKWDKTHPRGEACMFLEQCYWPFWFEMQDPGATQEKLEFRYPFFDRRVIDFVLAIPPIPWCVEKNIIRVAIGKCLPNQVRLRPKSPMVSDGISERGDKVAADWSRWLNPDPKLDRFIDVRKLSAPPGNNTNLWQALVPISLNCWLRSISN